MIDFSIVEQIDWEKALGVYTHSLKSVNGPSALSAYSRTLLREFLYRKDIPLESPKADVLFFKSLSPERYDYTRQYQDTIDAVQENLSIFDFSFYEEDADVVNLERLQSLREFRAIIPWLPHGSSEYRLCLYYAAVHALYLIRRMLPCEVRCLIVFSDMQTIDNIIVQYFQGLGIPTATLQHGLYVEYLTIDSINRVNYENCVAENFLAWGIKTGDLIKRYHPQVKIYLCGKIGLSVTQGPAERDVGEPKKSKKVVMALTDQNLFARENHTLLLATRDFCKKHNFEFLVRFHPQNNKLSYFESFPEMTECLDIEKADFLVGHSTTLLFEAALSGKLVAQLDSSQDKIVLNPKRLFHDALGLETVCKLNELASVEEHICDTGANARARYRGAIFDILSENQLE